MRTPGVRDLRPGDKICFYASPGVGIVAEAEAASEAEHSGVADDPFPMRFRVSDYHPIDPTTHCPTYDVNGQGSATKSAMTVCVPTRRCSGPPVLDRL